jgi:hypothetical protein
MEPCNCPSSQPSSTSGQCEQVEPNAKHDLWRARRTLGSHLVSQRRRIVRTGFFGQRLVAVLAFLGHLGHRAFDPLRWQQELEMWRMPGLSARVFAARLLRGPLGSAAPGRGGTGGLIRSFRRPSNSATRSSNAAMRASRSRHPGHSGCCTLLRQQPPNLSAAPVSRPERERLPSINGEASRFLTPFDHRMLV